MIKYVKLDDVINAIEDKIAEYIPTLYGRYEEIPLELRMTIEQLPTIEVSEDVISREQFREQMFHRCFEVDNDPIMQKWESGNWIRWKLFVEELDNAPCAISPVE